MENKTEKTENKQVPPGIDLGEIWGKMRPDEKEAAEAVCEAAEQRVGVAKDFLGSVGISDNSIKNLLELGLLEIKSRQAIAQEFVGKYRKTVESIDRRLREEIESTITEEENMLSRTYDWEKKLSLQSKEDARYRLTERAYNFVKSMIER